MKVTIMRGLGKDKSSFCILALDAAQATAWPTETPARRCPSNG